MPFIVVHTCNPSTERLRQEDHELEPSLDNLARLWFKIKIKKQEMKLSEMT